MHHLGLCKGLHIQRVQKFRHGIHAFLKHTQGVFELLSRHDWQRPAGYRSPISKSFLERLQAALDTI